MKSDTIGRTSIACIPDPSKKHRVEYWGKGYIEEIIQNLVCPKGISSDEPLTAEKGYYEETMPLSCCVALNNSIANICHLDDKCKGKSLSVKARYGIGHSLAD